MTQPTPYSRQYNATAWSQNTPNLPHPGTSLDAEYDAIKVTLDGVLRSILLIQRDDGALRNQSVRMDTLAPDVIVTLGAGTAWRVRGAWATGEVYVTSDVVTEGTGTFVCATSHTAGADFDTDKAAGKWVTLYDSAPDTGGGTVDTADIIDGAVTSAKLASSLDIAGSFRAQGGVAAGSATPGSLMRARNVAGNVLVEAERANANQGTVGFRALGAGGFNWNIAMPANSTDLTFGSDSTVYMRFTAAGVATIANTVQVLGNSPPGSGSGAEVYFVSNVGYFQSYNRTAGTWLATKVRGSSVFLSASGVDIAEVNGSGVDILSGTLKLVGGLEAGTRRVARRTTTTTLTAADAGGCVAITAGITVPSGVFAAGDAVSIYNNSGSGLTITQGSGLTLRLAGTGSSGDRTLAARGLATIWFNSATEAVMSGAGAV
jgi:hypothetical protein